MKPTGGQPNLGEINSKVLIVVAAEQDGKGIGRIRMARIPDFDRATLNGFIRSSVEPGSTIRTDGLNSYREIEGYVHNRKVPRRLKHGEHMLPRVHRAVSLLKRWMLGTHQGPVRHQHLEDYLNEFVFHFNRRKSASRRKALLPDRTAGRPDRSDYLRETCAWL